MTKICIFLNFFEKKVSLSERKFTADTDTEIGPWFCSYTRKNWWKQNKNCRLKSGRKLIYVILFFWFEPASWAQWHIFFCILLCEKLFLKHVLSTPVLLVCSSWMKSQIRRKRGINRDEIGRLRKMSLFSNKYLSFSTAKCHIFSSEIGELFSADATIFSKKF